mmetsp:Transcript_35114/g.76741  ORF Transcript_35114/g.76741 Transcript_35114/m.76741 type:complete len:200 (+) Transcript_35114:555-1154(+)
MHTQHASCKRCASDCSSRSRSATSRSSWRAAASAASDWLWAAAASARARSASRRSASSCARRVRTSSLSSASWRCLRSASAWSAARASRACLSRSSSALSASRCWRVLGRSLCRKVRSSSAAAWPCPPVSSRSAPISSSTLHARARRRRCLSSRIASRWAFSARSAAAPALEELRVRTPGHVSFAWATTFEAVSPRGAE